MDAMTVDYAVTMEAPRERVFHALTREADLRIWFAENAKMDLRPGGTLRISGRGAYAPGEMAIRAVDVPAKLVLEWVFHGQPSVVTFTLEADEAKTKVAVRHEFAAAPDIPRSRHLVEDLWRLHFTNLQGFLTSGKPELLPDFADPNPKVELSIWIDAPRAKVFRALMDPQWLHAWVNNEWVETHKTIVEPRVGGQYKYGWKYEVDGRPVDGGPTKIIELVENERLVTDWTDWRGDPEVPPQRIAWTLKDENGGTRLTMVHDRFVRVVDIGDYGGGWQYFLGAIKGVAEKGPA